MLRKHTSKFDPKTVVFTSFLFSKLNNEIEHKHYGIANDRGTAFR